MAQYHCGSGAFDLGRLPRARHHERDRCGARGHGSEQSTSLPGPMYGWYVRNAYLENNIRSPRKPTQCKTPVDLMQIDVPAYVLACREDHIVPWRTAYITTRLISGEVRFTLAASGHIAGVINPASRNKRSFWIDGELGKPQRWLETAREMAGSWWTDWSAW